ncbi:MAG: hypothetical protein ACO36I_08795 [Candidatus Latescibacterota bacterium]
MGYKKMEKPLKEKAKQMDAGVGPLQVVANNLSRWIMMLGVGMGVLGVVAFYYCVLPVGSMLMSIFLVSFTLYFFIRWWPEEDERPTPVPVSAPVEVSVPKPGRAMVQAVRLDGPPKVRCMMALREMVRRQETFQISQQGAEAFAKTIRFMLRAQK